MPSQTGIDQNETRLGCGSPGAVSECTPSDWIRCHVRLVFSDATFPRRWHGRLQCVPSCRPAPAQFENRIIRVCADPDNMPLSNQKGEGFEQKIAELIAKDWNAKIEYAWWPVRRGFFARALNGRYCDVAIQAPADFDMAAVTRPYFRSGYVFVTRKDSGLDIKSLADPRLKKLKIGVNILTPRGEHARPWREPLRRRRYLTGSRPSTPTPRLRDLTQLQEVSISHRLWHGGHFARVRPLLDAPASR